MPELKEIGKDFKSNFQKNAKKKPFQIAIAVVVVIALVSFILRKRSEAATQSIEYGDGETAIGYAGYPQVSGGAGMEGYDSSAMDELYESLDSVINSITQDYDTQISDITKYYDSQMEELNLSNASLSDRLTAVTTTIERQAETINRQQLIAQMKANSNMYDLVDYATKQQLHAQNLEIAEKLGLTFDSTTGNYFDDRGALAYTVAWQDAGGRRGTVVSGKQPTTPTTPTYNANTNYQAEINKAIASGASASTINALNEQRNAKISATRTTSANTYYDKNTDYSALIAKAKETGASQEVINNLTAQREAKIKGENLQQYA